jgi:hypothetical protein
MPAIACLAWLGFVTSIPHNQADGADLIHSHVGDDDAVDVDLSRPSAFLQQWASSLFNFFEPNLNPPKGSID